MNPKYKSKHHLHHSIGYPAGVVLDVATGQEQFQIKVN